MTGGTGDKKVDKPRPGHLDPGDTGLAWQLLDDRFGQRARRHSGRLCQGQGNIRRKVTLAQVLRRSHLNIDIEIGWNSRRVLQCAQGLRDEIVDDLLQELKPVPARGKMMRHFTRAHPPGPPIICTIYRWSPVLVLAPTGHAVEKPCSS